jgi:hypothetical protein
MSIFIIDKVEIYVAISSVSNYSSDTANAIALMCQGATSALPGKCFEAAMHQRIAVEYPHRY